MDAGGELGWNLSENLKTWLFVRNLHNFLFITEIKFLSAITALVSLASPG